MKDETRNTVKKVTSIIGTVLTVIIIALAAYLLLNMIICKAKNKPVSFFGVSLAIVQTNSMEPEIMTGDLIVFKKVSYSSVKVGDTIVFIADENFDKNIQGKTVVHKVIEITPKGLRTKGVNNSVADGGYREASEVVGICTGHSTTWGNIFAFCSNYGLMLVVPIFAGGVVVMQAIRIVKAVKMGKQEKQQVEEEPVGATLTDEERESLRQEVLAEMQNEGLIPSDCIEVDNNSADIEEK